MNEQDLIYRPPRENKDKKFPVAWIAIDNSDHDPFYLIRGSEELMREALEMLNPNRKDKK